MVEVRSCRLPATAVTAADVTVQMFNPMMSCTVDFTALEKDTVKAASTETSCKTCDYVKGRKCKRYRSATERWDIVGYSKVVV